MRSPFFLTGLRLRLRLRDFKKLGLRLRLRLRPWARIQTPGTPTPTPTPTPHPWFLQHLTRFQLILSVTWSFCDRWPYCITISARNRWSNRQTDIHKHQYHALHSCAMLMRDKKTQKPTNFMTSWFSWCNTITWCHYVIISSLSHIKADGKMNIICWYYKQQITFNKPSQNNKFTT